MKITLVGFGLKRGTALVVAIQNLLPPKMNSATEILIGRNFSHARQSVEIKVPKKHLKYANQVFEIATGRNKHFRTVTDSECYTLRREFSRPKVSRRMGQLME